MNTAHERGPRITKTCPVCRTPIRCTPKKDRVGVDYDRRYCSPYCARVHGHEPVERVQPRVVRRRGRVTMMHVATEHCPIEQSDIRHYEIWHAGRRLRGTSTYVGTAAADRAWARYEGVA